MFIDVSISNCQYLTNANMQVDTRKNFIQIIENRMIQNLRRNVELKCGNNIARNIIYDFFFKF